MTPHQRGGDPLGELRWGGHDRTGEATGETEHSSCGRRPQVTSKKEMDLMLRYTS
jgi:hypothetical protein